MKHEGKALEIAVSASSITKFLWAGSGDSLDDDSEAGNVKAGIMSEPAWDLGS